MAKALNDYAPIQSGIMSTIHAYMGDQMILDGTAQKRFKKEQSRRCQHRLNSTGAAKAIGLVIPELNGKLIGFRTACSGSDWFHYYSDSRC